MCIYKSLRGRGSPLRQHVLRATKRMSGAPIPKGKRLRQLANPVIPLVMSADRLRIQRKTFCALSHAELAAWSRLLRDSTSTRWAFLSPVYAAAVHECIGTVEVLLCWRGDELAGVMLLQRARGWLGRMGLREPAGGQMSDYFGLLASPGVQLQWSVLLNAAGLHCLYFTHLDETQAAHGLVGQECRIGLRTRIHPDGGAAHWEYLRTQDKKLVSDTERRERKLAAEHGALVFEMQTPTPQQDLDWLVTLKNAQYQRTGHDGGALLDPANARLLQRLLTSSDAYCQPRLSVLRSGGQMVAAHFGLQCGAVLHYWFPVYDQRFAVFSPGRILFRHILAVSDLHGIACIDRGEGDSAAKRDFANEEHVFCKGIVTAGLWGHALRGVQSACWRLTA